MASIIPGFEYDVFVSYRHKDNKGDHWVTEFVYALRAELEVTSKDEVSVYFDENPYDGIQDGHEVNDSLNSKLNCLIFIPIISQTYCDPKSYAWSNEFLRFKEQASADKLGMKVRLKNGNVANRIVPVRIHEPEVYDSLLLVKEIGSALRPIDFIFQSPGVNRPLRVKEDHPNDNRNKIYYRDQINKLANLIKDILVAVKFPESKEELHRAEKESPRSPTTRLVLKRGVVFSFVLLALLCLAITFYKLASSSSTTPTRISIAIIPLKVVGEEDDSRYFADGVMDVVRSNLSMFPELRVKSRTSVERYKDEPKSIREIAKELDVIYILEGSAQKLGNNIRVVVQLVDARTDINIWSQKFDKHFENVLEIENQISESIARSLKAKITNEIAARISRAPTENFEAYDLFLRGKQAGNEYSKSDDIEDLRLGIHLLRQSLEKDPQFALGYAWLAGLMVLVPSPTAEPDSVLLLANKALELDSSVVEAQLVLSGRYFAKREDVNALRYTYNALKNDRIDSALGVDLIKRLGAIYSRIGDTDRALFFFNEIEKINPGDIDVLHSKFYALAADHRVGKLLELAEQIKKIDAADTYVNLIGAHLALEKKDYGTLEKICSGLFQVTTENSANEFDVIYAWTLKKNGKERESLRVTQKCENQTIIDPYFNAQVRLLRDENTKALQLLKSAEIGWYNLNLCYINPVFDNVRGNAEFVNFLSKTKSRLVGLRERVHELEQQGYLQKPEEFLTEVTTQEIMGT